jgi:hypothetical protein
MDPFRLRPINLIGKDLKMNLSTFAFITAMSFINADGNITSLSLQRTTGVYEGNPLAAPLAEGDSHYINNAAAIGLCVVAHDELKDLDRRIGLENQFGTKDIFTIGVVAVEVATISSWGPYRKADTGWEIGLSEAEFLITASVLHIDF